MELKYKIWIGIASAIAIALLIILVLLSYDSLTANQIGLDYNGITVKIDPTKLYTVGKYFLGVGHRFLKYNFSLQFVSFTMNDTLKARTQEGLSIGLAINFQYILNNNVTEIISLNSKYGEDLYKSAYIKIAKSSLINTVSSFSANQVFNNRSGLANSMINSLSNALIFEHCILQGLQIVNISMPLEYNDALVLTQNLFLSRDIANVILNNTKAIVTNKLNQAKAEVGIIRNNADILTQLIYQNSNVTTFNRNNYLSNMKQGYMQIKSQLNFSNKDLITFLFSYNLGNLNYVNFPVPNLIKCLSNSSLAQCT